MVAVGGVNRFTDRKYARNVERVFDEADIGLLLANWCAANTLAEAMAVLEEHRVPCGPVYNAADMMEDEHFKYRELFEAVEINGESLKIPALLPKLRSTPGGTEWPGPEVGSHTDEVLQSLGLDSARIAELKTEGIVADA